MAKPLKHQLLSRALQLISDERTWTQRAIARTAADKPCCAADPKAIKFCALGAIQRASFELMGEVDGDLTKAAVRHVSGYFALPFINDSEGRQVVISLFQMALERA